MRDGLERMVDIMAEAGEKLALAEARIAELEKENATLKQRIRSLEEETPMRQEDWESPCTYHGTTIAEIADAQNDPNARVIHPFDSQDSIVVRIGDKVVTKYGDEWTIKAFTNHGIAFEETDKCLDECRIGYVIEKGNKE